MSCIFLCFRGGVRCRILALPFAVDGLGRSCSSLLRRSESGRTHTVCDRRPSATAGIGPRVGDVRRFSDFPPAYAILMRGVRHGTNTSTGFPCEDQKRRDASVSEKKIANSLANVQSRHTHKQVTHIHEDQCRKGGACIKACYIAAKK